MAKGTGKGGNRERKDYSVYIFTKDGEQHVFHCGSSLRGARECLKACQLFGAKVIKNGVIVADKHKATVGDTSILTPEQLAELQ
jgi:phage FluMu gp28-like protein